MTAHRPNLSWMKLFLALVSHSSDVGSIPIARSISSVGAVGLTGLPSSIWRITRRVLDAVGRDFTFPFPIGHDKQCVLTRGQISEAEV
jgi:hypothetical protein